VTPATIRDVYYRDIIVEGLKFSFKIHTFNLELDIKTENDLL
jgi:hypothetical protein